MPERPKKKVLILMLGMGGNLTNGVPVGYVETSYPFGGDGEIVESAYVAEPLVRAFRPDMIFVIGTVKVHVSRLIMLIEQLKTEIEKNSDEVEKAYTEGLKISE